jgi:tetratricopeptide (TPR) repeat protein
MTPDPDRTQDFHSPTGSSDPDLKAGLAAASDPYFIPGCVRSPLLRDEPYDHDPLGEVARTELPGASRYQLRGAIARGGMGAVFRVADTNLDRDLAVKVLLADAGPRPDLVRRFEAEAKLTAGLQHPGVVPIHEVGVLADGRPFYAMKLVRGKTLTDLLTARASPADELPKFLDVVLSICRTVAYAHSRGVIHRDLKPLNVMVGDFGEVQVMDWGLAKPLAGRAGRESGEAPDPAAAAGPVAVETEPASDPAVTTDQRAGDDTPEETQAGSVLGTPAYMPPEQACGELDRVDRRSDVFALGAILCEVLTGAPPYPPGGPEAVLARAAAGAVGPARERLAGCGVDPELTAMAARCLAPDPADRPADAGSVAELLEAYRAGVEDRARRADADRAAAESEAREQRKRRKFQLALAAAVGLLIVGLGMFGWYADRKATERRLQTGAAREQVTRLLMLATELRSEYQLKQAAAALAEARDAAEAVPDLLPAVEQARADLAFVIELDAIRGKRSTWVPEEGGKGRFDSDAAPPAYRAAFAVRGLDVVSDPDTAGAGVAASAVRAELLVALDDWLALEPDAAVRKKVLTTVSLADPGSPVGPFRDPAVWEDDARLAELATEARIADLPAGAAVAIAGLLDRKGLDPAPVLRRAVAAHPRDFTATFTLGYVLHFRADNADEVIGAYRAARALRPDHPVTLKNLGAVLCDAKRDYDAAAACFREAIRLDPTDSRAHIGLGAVCDGKRNREGAIACFREAIRLDPKDVVAHRNLAKTRLDFGDIDGAIAEYREATRLDPANARTHCRLGIALLAKKDVVEAEREFREAIWLDPNFALAHISLGSLLCDEKRDYDGAIACFRQAIRLDPKLAVAHYFLGIALHDKGDFSGSVAACREVIRLDPSYVKAHYNLGNALKKKGDYDGSIAAYQEEIRLNPKFAKAHIGLGAVLCDVKRDYDRATACFREAIRLDPSYAWAHHNLGNALFGKRDLDGAVAEYREAIRLDPNHAEAYGGLGNVLGYKQDYDGAARALRELIRLNPKVPLAYYNLGLALGYKRDYDGAVTAFREAIRLDPKNVSAHISLGAILCDIKRDYDGSVAAFREATRLDPSDVRAQFNLGVALRGKGDLDGSVAAFRQAIRLGPNHPEAHCFLGQLLQRQGRPAEGLPLLRRGHELGNRRAGWSIPSAKWVAECERAVAEQAGRAVPPPREVKP